jgi:methyl-accepting chemotaxis protein
MNKSLILKISISIAVLLLVILVSQIFISATIINKTSLVIEDTIKARIERNQEDVVNTNVEDQSHVIAALFEHAESSVNGYSSGILYLIEQAGTHGWDSSTLRELLNGYLKTSIEANPNLLGLYLVMERDELGNTDSMHIDDEQLASNDVGRLSVYWAYETETDVVAAVMTEEELADDSLTSSQKEYNSWYTCPLNTKKLCVLEPYVDGVGDDKILMTSVAMPIQKNGKVIGVVGVDISLDSLQELSVNGTKSLAEGAGDIALISNTGYLASYSENADSIGSHIKGVLPAEYSLDSIRSETDEHLLFNTPVILPGEVKWYLLVKIPKSFIKEQVASVVKVLNSGTRSQIVGVSVGGVVIGLIGLFIMYIMIAKLIKPVRSVANALREISQGDGDLTQRITVSSEDEVGDLAKYFNEFVEKLVNIIRQLGDSIDESRSTAITANSLATKTSNGMNTTQENILMVATASEQMSQTSAEVARNSAETASSAQLAENATREGRAVVITTSDNIKSLSVKMADSMPIITKLSSDSENISAVLQVISGIAQQTNLLALNAAIEAARAGEQGRGFAVVADEVRALAARTTESIIQIEGVIGELQGATKDAVTEMEESSRMAGDYAVQVQEAITSLDTINDGISEISMKAIQIATAAEEQSAVAEDINRNVQSIQDVAIDVASDATQSAGLSDQISHMSEQQKGLIGQFKY